MRCGVPCSVTPLTPPERLGLWLWWALCLLLALPALALRNHLAPLDLAVPLWAPLDQALVLRPEQGWHQSPWSWWSTAWLHGSTPHLLRNLAGVALLAALGGLMRPTLGAALAWGLAWPLTHLGMLLEPGLASYVGLSGVLHAGVVALALPAVMPWSRQPPAPPHPWDLPLKLCGAALLLGVTLKILMENPWAHALLPSSASAINVAPWAHLSGSAAGALSTWMVMGVGWLTRRRH